MQITLRLAPEVLSLRRQSLLKTFAASLLGAQSFGLKVNEFSILGNHFHLIAEASSNDNLSRGMQSLLIRLAKSLLRLARELERPLAAAVFAGRYHLRVLKTPTEMKNALAYVLMNEAEHGGRPASLSIFSSSFRFKGWDHFKIKFSLRETRKIEDFWQKLERLDQTRDTESNGEQKPVVGSRGRKLVADTAGRSNGQKSATRPAAHNIGRASVAVDTSLPTARPPLGLLEQALSPAESWLQRVGWQKA